MSKLYSIIEFLTADTFGMIFLICLAIYLFYIILNILFGFIDWIFGDSKTFRSNSKERLGVSKIEFLRQVVNWCAQNLGLPADSKRLPNITLRYYEHKRYGGVYFQGSKEIVLYWDSHSDLINRINTIIHEYQHFLDIRNKKHDKEYAKELNTVGYQKNIFEKRARKTASDWERNCYDAMVSKGIIIK
jgi:hypothetical protein